MSNSWQTPLALAIVAITIALFVARIVRNRKVKPGGGCGAGCGCTSKPEDKRR